MQWSGIVESCYQLCEGVGPEIVVGSWKGIDKSRFGSLSRRLVHYDSLEVGLGNDLWHSRKTVYVGRDEV